MHTASLLRRLAALLAIGAAASCNSDRSTSPPPPLPAPSADLVGDALSTTTSTTQKVVGTLLSCEPLPYASDSKVIGPAGGELRLGPHILRVPASALERPVRISGEAPSDSVRSVRLFPEGLDFKRPASLTLNYEGCSLIVGLAPRVAYTTESLLILEYLPSVNDPFEQTVTGRLKHFSRYAAAW